MKKYIKPLLLGIITGIFLFNLFLKQYTDYDGIKVSSTLTDVYLLQMGVYSSLENMEENTLKLQNYVYNKDGDLYYVYIGISKNKLAIEKIQKYYKDLGYDTIIKEFSISNKKFIKELENYDEIILNTNDSTALLEIINDTLISYEEEVISGSDD